MRRNRRGPAKPASTAQPQAGNWTADPLKALLDQAKDARQKVAGAKGLVTLGGQEAKAARRAADQVLNGLDRWKPVNSGFRGIGDALALSEACIGTTLAHSTNAQDNCTAAAKSLASLEGLLHSLHDGLSKLAEAQPC
jgi:hypothetical protein